MYVYMYVCMYVDLSMYVFKPMYVGGGGRLTCPYPLNVQACPQGDQIPQI